jgi:ferredoxin
VSGTQPALPSLDDIAGRVTALGLLPRGALACGAGDGVPDQPDGRASRTLLLIGNAGGSLWPEFQGAPEASDGRPDPLDRWSRRVIGGLAEMVGALALFPFGGPPYLPFLTWAQRAEPLAVSPLGMMIHPDYGLWHAYRGALAFAETLPLPAVPARPSPCESCREKPCLTACPVGAFTAEGYGVTACVDHVAAPQGVDCLDLGCRARRACPVGRGYRYPAPQARLHMEAFLAARRR